MPNLTETQQQALRQVGRAWQQLHTAVNEGEGTRRVSSRAQTLAGALADFDYALNRPEPELGSGATAASSAPHYQALYGQWADPAPVAATTTGGGRDVPF